MCQAPLSERRIRELTQSSRWDQHSSQVVWLQPAPQDCPGPPADGFTHVPRIHRRALDLPERIRPSQGSPGAGGTETLTPRGGRRDHGSDGDINTGDKLSAARKHSLDFPHYDNVLLIRSQGLYSLPHLGLMLTADTVRYGGKQVWCCPPPPGSTWLQPQRFQVQSEYSRHWFS